MRTAPTNTDSASVLQFGALCEQFSGLHIPGKGNPDLGLTDRPGYWHLEYLHHEMPDALALGRFFRIRLLTR
ncbi:hypothetical protein [Streptomyces sp. 4R-3d]|uniref:hypothetical protein n=1 Tax=Streptomyces sp. 4R-3d TaxID=2559605 RepID=UPI001073D373|nr:hypothetical protein [Streptomyces sp. 4R-3d]TFI19746.1 hypothetical protein E4P36_38340 [Streptomyces sp. 4R-3d]